MAAALEQYVNTVQNLSSQGKISVMSNLFRNRLDLYIVIYFKFSHFSYILSFADNSY